MTREDMDLLTRVMAIGKSTPIRSSAVQPFTDTMPTRRLDPKPAKPPTFLRWARCSKAALAAIPLLMSGGAFAQMLPASEVALRASLIKNSGLESKGLSWVWQGSDVDRPPLREQLQRTLSFSNAISEATGFVTVIEPEEAAQEASLLFDATNFKPHAVTMHAWGAVELIRQGWLPIAVRVQPVEPVLVMTAKAAESVKTLDDLKKHRVLASDGGAGTPFMKLALMREKVLEGNPKQDAWFQTRSVTQAELLDQVKWQRADIVCVQKDQALLILEAQGDAATTKTAPLKIVFEAASSLGPGAAHGVPGDIVLLRPQTPPEVAARIQSALLSFSTRKPEGVALFLTDMASVAAQTPGGLGAMRSAPLFRSVQEADLAFLMDAQTQSGH